jgi:hypothetical protein
MSQLPRVASAILDDRKIIRYLLNTVHPTGAPKTKFFISFGFSPDAPPHTMENSLLRSGESYASINATGSQDVDSRWPPERGLLAGQSP